MKHNIKTLPKRKQQDLHQLVGLIREEVKDVVMIILYGSYTKGKYVERDERRDFNVRTCYMSDYDLLVITRRRLGSREITVSTRVKNRFMQDKDPEYQTYPQIINESISHFNHDLEEGRYFYTEIRKQGIMLYDSGEYQLAKPRRLNYAEIKKMVKEYYGAKFARAIFFREDAETNIAKGRYTHASFYLHQAAEYFLKSIPLVYVLYGYKEHDLEFLIEKCKPYTLELAKVFLQDTSEEKRLFELLRSAYIETRYNDKFVVTKEDIEKLIPKIKLLQQIVDSVCQERFSYYDSQTKK